MLAEEAIFANDAYYLAFQHKNLSAMESLWAQAAAVTCIHPGWPPLIQRDDIIESWRQIFSNEKQPGIVAKGAKAFLNGNTALVVCYETVDGGALVATNGFIKQADDVYIFHHQASHCAIPLEMGAEAKGAVN